MSSEAPATKRQRTEEVSITMCSELWFSDGNVVLQAGNTQFRVHWGILAHNSLVFHEMQELLQPPEHPGIEGCPVVELSDDAEDVGYLLNALYTPTFHSQKTLSLPVLRALLRLGRKYGFKDLRDSAATRITTEYPTTLQENDALPDSWETIEWYEGMIFDIVTLISENNILTALPLACYRAVQLTTIDDLFDGILKEDGTRASLSPGDLRRCLRARQKLLVKQFEPGYTFGWARKWEFADCASPAVCDYSRETILANYMEDYAIYAFLKPDLNDYTFCVACTRHATDSMTAGRKKMWQELPKIFDLPRWSELKSGL
ncbi:BTB domain-containing protein [Mycena sanguinolenta]|uniref:BTB domain-containing protein n=1 Tax=Mycena sanguinolenta TaxID=230812 RepID=A0A8H7DFL3_9AGAR|nr:BTB domain-containing protein [Mycena sanguinolenta]